MTQRDLLMRFTQRPGVRSESTGFPELSRAHLRARGPSNAKLVGSCA